jgi:hypothetical protein
MAYVGVMPFTALPVQQMTVSLPTGTFDFYVRWNERLGIYAMTITNTLTQVVVIQNVALLLGVALLSAYDLGLGEFVCVAEDGVDLDAAFDDLGVRINVYYVSPDLLNNEGD